MLVKGHVQRRSGIAWKLGMHVASMIPSFQHLLPDPDLNYMLVKRETLPNRRVNVIAIRLGEANSNRLSSANVAQMARDKILVFGLGNRDQQALIGSLLDSLGLQAQADQPARTVSVSLKTRFPGEYSLTENMTSEQLLDALGG